MERQSEGVGGSQKGYERNWKGAVVECLLELSSSIWIGKERAVEAEA